jgi:hypothetical protein
MDADKTGSDPSPTVSDTPGTGEPQDTSAAATPTTKAARAPRGGRAAAKKAAAQAPATEQPDTAPAGPPATAPEQQTEQDRPADELVVLAPDEQLDEPRQQVPDKDQRQNVEQDDYTDDDEDDDSEIVERIEELLRGLSEQWREELDGIWARLRILEERTTQIGPLSDRVYALEDRVNLIGSLDSRIYTLENLPGMSSVPDLPQVKDLVAQLIDAVGDLPEQARRLRKVRQRVRDLQDLPARVQALENQGGSAVVVPQQPQTGNVTDLALRAEMAALQIRDDFSAAEQNFLVRTGLDPAVLNSGDDQSLAARTVRMLAVAAATADAGATRYADLQNDPNKQQFLTRATFAGEVQRAGSYYETTVADVEKSASQATAADSAAYADLLTDLRKPSLVTAIETTVKFTP